MMKLFKRRPKTPNGFVRAFMKDSKKKWCQLELYYKGKVILQAESLKYVPIIMEHAKVNKKNYTNGFVVHFFIEQKDIPKGDIYRNYLLNKNKLEMIEYEDKDLDIINYAYFFKKDVDPLDMADYMKKIIEATHIFKEINPQILFNIRYLKWDEQPKKIKRVTEQNGTLLR